MGARRNTEKTKMPRTIISLLRQHEAVTREIVKLEQDLASLQKQIVAAGRTVERRGRPRGNTADTVAVVKETVQVLRDAGGPLPRREIAARLGITSWAVAYRLQKAIESKLVEKAGMGRYRCTNIVPLS